MTDRLIVADASKVSGKEFFDALFPRRTPEEQAERVRLCREHYAAIRETWSLPFEEGMAERARLSAEFAALIEAGKTEYMILRPDRSDLEKLADEAHAEARLMDAEQMTECHGDPLLNKRRAA
jgi:hypothetical protein